MEKIITLGIRELSRDRFHTHPNMDKPELDKWFMNKPAGSLWGSTYTPDDEYVSDWERWADGEDYCHYNDGVIYTLNPDTRIYTIDSRIT